MLGQPVSMLIPEVVGFKLTGKLNEGVTATDLVLTATQMLRAKGVVGRFVEYFGPGLASLSLADRATLANMAPEYGATCGFFGIDDKTLDYLRLTGREEDQIALVEAYAKEQGFWLDPDGADPIFTDTLELDMAHASSPRSPAPSARRTRSRCPTSTTCSTTSSPTIYKQGRADARAGRGQGPRHRRRRRGDRRDHQLHQHLQPRACWSPPASSPRRPTSWASSPSRGSRPASRRDRRSSPTISIKAGPAGASRRDRLQPGRLWLHHLHRQFGPAGRADQQGDQRQQHRRRLRCSRATATSRAASRPTCAPTSSPRRRWSSPMRSRAR